MSEKLLPGVVILILSAASLGCEPREEAEVEEATAEEASVQEARAEDRVARAVAVLYPTQGSEARGTVVFRRVGTGIAIEADVGGLASGPHGFHIHERGDCTAPDGTSAGGHFNPAGSSHGAPTDQERHVGDLGNVTANEAGAALYERTDDRIAFEGSNSIIGRAVIVHAGEDDLVSQPTGDAGARVACGVIGIAGVTAGM